MKTNLEGTVSMNSKPTAVRRRARRTGVRAGAVLLASAGVFSATMFTSAPAPIGAASVKAEGIACADPNGSSVGVKNYVLTAKSGIINMPDGNSMVMWSYTNANGAFQYPGPVLCADQGDTVTVTLRNELPVPTSAQFVGIDNVKVNGRPAQAQFDGAGVLQSLTNDAGFGHSVTYTFKADEPGTYLYQSGTDQQLQIEMGLVGAVIIYPATVVTAAALAALPVDERAFARLAYNDPTTIYSTEHEYMLMLTELDPDVHYAVEEGGLLRSAEYMGTWKPRYFMINGRSFPDVLAPNGAAWLPSQPYGALAHVEPFDPISNPLPALIRYLAVGGESYPFHPHSNHEKVIAKDGRMLADGATDLSMEKFAIVVEPGSTIDATFIWTNVEDYNFEDGSQGPVPVPIPSQANLTEGNYWSGSPFIGGSGVLNPEVQGKNVCGEYYHVAHNHNLAEATNYGAAFGGQLTLIRVDPSNAANCGNV